MPDPTRAAVARVFHDAVNQPPSDRPGFLDRACGGDAALRAKVEDLFAALEMPDDFLAPLDGIVPDMAAAQAAMTSGEPEPPESPGARIGRYRLLKLIGEGGFGAVYMAEQDHPVRRRVALKIIKPGMDTKQVIARFEAERQALAMMDHPNIAKVLDAGQTPAGRPFFVMELVDGRPITSYCDENRLDTRSRLELFVRVCSAVQHAHQKAVIHRDLKPGNVLVSVQEGGRPLPRVIDFGIAKAINQRLTDKTLLTGLGHFVGTPKYMSPEQADAGGVDIDTRTDIYSLGVILYELLTGTTPMDPEELRSKAYGEIQRILREVEPPRPSTRLGTLGSAAASSVAVQRRTEPRKLGRMLRGDLDWVVMKCLEKDRTRRYDTANSLSQDVERYLRGQTVLARAPSAAYRLRKYIRRHRLGLIAGSAIAASLVMLLGALVYGVIREANQRQQHSLNLQLEQAKTFAAERQARDAVTVQRYLDGVTQALSLMSTDATGRTWEAFDAVAKLPQLDRAVRDPLELRSLAARCLATFDIRKTATLRRDLNARCLAFSPDGKRVAIGKHRGLVFWVDVVDVESARVVNNYPVIGLARTRETGIASVAFSPDGKWLVAGTRDGSMYAWTMGSATPSRLKWSAHGAAVDDLAFFPGRPVILSCSADGTLKAFDLEAGGKEVCGVEIGRPSSNVACSPTGDAIVVAGDAGLRAFTVDLSAQTPKFEPLWSADGNYRKVRFSPDGRALAASRDNNILLLDPAARGAEISSLRDPAIDASHREGISHLEFSPDGSLLVSGSADRTLKLWELASGRVAASSVVPGTGNVYPAFAPDGRHLACTDDDCVVLYEIGGVGVQSLRARHAHPILAMDVAAAPGKTTLVCLSQKRAPAGPRAAELSLWDLGDGRLIRSHDLTGRSYDEQPLWAHSVAHDPSQDLTAYALEGQTGLLRAAAATRQLTAPVEGHVTLRLSPRGDLVWGVTGGTLTAWDTGDLRVTHRWTNVVSDLLTGNSSLPCLAVGAARIAVGARDGKIRLFNLGTMSGPVAEWGFGVPVHSIALSPDESLLVAGGQDGRVQVFEVASGKSLVQVAAHRDNVDSVCFAPASTQVFASGSRDGIIHLWRCSPAGVEKVLTLESPGGGPVRMIRFSTDGRDLIALFQNEKAVRVFHLDRMRDRLQRVALQW